MTQLNREQLQFCFDELLGELGWGDEIEETGVSLKASGWYLDKELAGGGQWKHTDGKPRRTDQPVSIKQRWAKDLQSAQQSVHLTGGILRRQQAFSTPEQLPLGGADTTPPTRK